MAVAFFLVIVCLPLSRHWLLRQRGPFSYYYEFTDFLFYLSDAAVILFLVATIGWAWRRRASIGWGPAAITLPLALLPARALISVFWAEDTGLAAYLTVRLTLLLLPYLAIVTLRPPRQLLQVSLATTLAIQAAVAVAQFARQDDLGWRLFGEIPLSATPGGPSIITVGGRTWLRGYGLTPHPNILGGILASVLLSLVVAYLESRGRQRVAWLFLLALGAIGLLVTFSRAAWLGAGAGAVLLLLAVLARRPWRQQYGRLFLAPAAATLIGAAAFGLLGRELFLARLGPAASYTESRSLSEREALADASLTLIRLAPWRGVGAGNFTGAVAPLVEEVPGVTPQPVHNVPLLLAAELGLAGGALWLWLMLAPLFLAWRRLSSGRLSLWGLGLTAGLLALALIDLFDFYSWGWPQGRLLRWVYFALWAKAMEEPVTF